MALTACDDYLEVEAPSSFTTEFIFESETEANTALNGVYAQLLSGNTFGNLLYNGMMLNSDVDYSTSTTNYSDGNSPRRFDNRADGGNVEKLWNALYAGVESANEYIYNLKNASIYKVGTKVVSSTVDNQIVETEVPDVTEVTQMMGEAKVIRAMFYHELLSYWGDIPFTMQATYETGNLLPDVTARQTVSDALIADLKEAAEYMYSDTTSTVAAPERISQEAAYAMIARLALQAGGYSLHPTTDSHGNPYKMERPANYRDYYQTAQEYTKKIIDRGTHSLTKSFRDVFVDECNFIVAKNDDPIFEIPFAKEANGSWGYSQGPKADSNEGTTANYGNWGKCGSGAYTSVFYRHQFAETDTRRDYVNGLWGYASTGVPSVRYDFNVYNNKWSKLWNTTGIGATTEGNTGINFAYIRYADVLLMFAEADNELNNGPTAEAKAALKQVRERAFRGAEDAAEQVDEYVASLSTKDAFLKAVLDERKFEFAGENMRWKDLVRNNMYAEEMFYTFLTYYTLAESHGGSPMYLDMVEEHQGIAIDNFATSLIYTYVANPGGDVNFPNDALYKLFILNPYEFASTPAAAPQSYLDANGIALTAVSPNTISADDANKNVAWTAKEIDWWREGTISDQIHYSLYGFMRSDPLTGQIAIVGLANSVNPLTVNVSQLPAVRYILPIPEEAIQRSAGKYSNQYGY